MDRQAYNDCMKPYISGKGMSKEERRLRFCVGAKVCSGKAKTEEEAAQVCSVPKAPKWARSTEEEQLSCPERVQRAKGAIEGIMLKVKVGEAEGTIDIAKKAVNDVFACRVNDPELLAAAEDAFNSLKEISGRHYLKGEIKELGKKFELVGALL